MVTFREKFNVSTLRLHADDSSGSGMSRDGGEILSVALERAFSDACFLMGEGGCRVEITAQCATCNGAGVVGGTARRKGGRCKACKGQATRLVASFLAEPSNACEIWRHGERISAPVQEQDRKEARENRQGGELRDRVLRSLEQTDKSAAGVVEWLGFATSETYRVESALCYLVAIGKVRTFERAGVQWFQPVREVSRAG